MHPDEQEIYTEWLAVAPKGVRWDRAQEMWEEYKRKRQEQAEEVAKRLLGGNPKRLGICGNFAHGNGQHEKSATCDAWQIIDRVKLRCPSCYGAFPEFCKRCNGTGEVDA